MYSRLRNLEEKRGSEILHQREFEILPSICVADGIDFTVFGFVASGRCFADRAVCLCS